MDSLPSLHDVVKTHNLFAKKSLGQHFLLDLNITDKIARLATPHPAIAEVGPGPGALTRSLLGGGAEKLWVIEMDARFIPILEDIKTQVPDRLEIVHADALKVDISALCSTRPLRICANLPYNVGTKLVTNWLSALPVFWDKMVLMLQKEVAERLAAQPGSASYGRLSVLAQSTATAHIAFGVPAQAFTPPPKVQSAVIVLDALPKGVRYAHLPALSRLTQAVFSQRRKMLRKSLQPLAQQWKMDVETWLDKAGIDPKLRPQDIDIKGFHRLTNIARAANRP